MSEQQTDTPATEQPSGLRERKKAETRERIVAAALDLFASQGFEETTVAQIAEAADISPRTFFGYFPSKEAVVFHDTEELLGALRERLSSRKSGEDAFDAMRAWILERDAEGRFDKPHEQLRYRLTREVPALTAHDRAVAAEFEATLARAVAEDLDVEPDSLRPHLVAAAAVAALDAVSTRHHEQAEPTPGDAEEVLAEALAFLSGGLRALRRLPY